MSDRLLDNNRKTESMKLYLTNGMFAGEALIEEIGTETSDVKKVLEHIFGWKNDEENRRKYKIEPYDRFIFDEKNHQIAIDFGDYRSFMLVIDVTEI